MSNDCTIQSSAIKIVTVKFAFSITVSTSASINVIGCTVEEFKISPKMSEQPMLMAIHVRKSAKMIGAATEVEERWRSVVLDLLGGILIG